MKFLKDNIVSILAIGIAVLLTLQLTSLFRGSYKSEEMIRKEMKIEALEEKRISDSITNKNELKAKDELIAILKDRDTVLSIKYIQGNEKIKNIPAAVNSLDRENLRAAVQRHALLPD